MPYFPLANEAREYTCEGCHQRFRIPKGGVTTSCCVLHAPGTCCHFGEEQLSQPNLPFDELSENS